MQGSVGARPQDHAAAPLGAAVAPGAGTRGRALITRRLQLPRLERAWPALRAEALAQRERLLLWVPVAFGAGAAAYLGLKDEPAATPALGAVQSLAVVTVAAWRWGRSVWLAAAAGLALAASAGFFLAKLSSDAAAAPIAPPGLGMTVVEGWVVDVDTPSERGERLLIAPVWIAGLAPAATPTRIRIVVGAPGGPDAVPPPGSAVRLKTLVDPPPGPAAPGAYDFAREAWFEGVGGVGLTLQQPSLTVLPPPPWRLRLEMAIGALRWRVAQTLVRQIRQVMGPEDGGAAGLAAAVTTSHQDWMAGDQRDALRNSGLAHMLAIAGLHTAAVSGAAFAFFRLLIAAVPWLALRLPGKKVAAGAAIVVVATYLVLSGAHPPARRAAITAIVAFVAILLDRRAVSLHALAVAATIILLAEPSVVVQPGFEMSFCATASLVALAEVWRRPATPPGLPWPLRLLQRARDGLLALFVVSLVAGAATGPFTIQHFNRVANWGVFANLTADFVASAIMMPALALCLAAQVLGLGAGLAFPFLALAGWAARSVIALGRFFATAPGASITIASAPQIALAISYLGIVFACLWRGRLRVAGIMAAFAVALWPRPTPPAAWIAADGDDAAIVVDGMEVPLKPGARAYATGVWAQRRGFRLPADATAAQALQTRLFDCNRSGCAPLSGARPAIGAWWTRRKPKPERLIPLCESADIFILRADVEVPRACRDALVLRRGDFEAGGAAEVFATPSGGWRLVWAQPIRGRRPWTEADTVQDVRP